MDRGNGIVIDGPSVNNQWFTDGYGDYIRHFLVGFAAIPEWAPRDANHMTDSTSAVQSISYSATSVSYVTRETASSETFRLVFVPGAVRIDGQALPQRPDLEQPGWTYDAATRVLRIRHDAGTNVEVLSGALICSSGLDDDGDGLVDLADPACSGGLPALPDSSAPLESTQCQDGLDNNGDGRIDFDGGQSIHGACGGGACPPGVSDLDANGVADSDPWCAARPWKDKEESSGCGLGAELVGVGLLLHVLRSGRRRVRSDGA